MSTDTSEAGWCSSRSPAKAGGGTGSPGQPQPPNTSFQQGQEGRQDGTVACEGGDHTFLQTCPSSQWDRLLHPPQGVGRARASLAWLRVFRKNQGRKWKVLEVSPSILVHTRLAPRHPQSACRMKSCKRRPGLHAQPLGQMRKLSLQLLVQGHPGGP